MSSSSQPVAPQRQGLAKLGNAGLGNKPPLSKLVKYYIPLLDWLPEYKARYLMGDMLGGLTISFILIPASLSYASSLAKVPPICGLVSIILPPLIYVVLGSCRHMQVGPEASLSILMGETIRSHLGSHGTDEMAIAMVSCITFIIGCFILMAGVLRLGFLDSVFSRALLRGFISAVAFVIFGDQLTIELGLAELAEQEHTELLTPFGKTLWALRHFGRAHRLTALISLSVFTSLLLAKFVKKRLSKRAPWVLLFPDLFTCMIIVTLLTNYFDWDLAGVAVLGKIDSTVPHPSLPLSRLDLLQKSFTIGLLCAILGFFDSVIAAKSLSSKNNYSVSANRELVAFGAANLFSSLFGSLPIFGSYGRSKVMSAAGAHTQMATLISVVVCALSIRFLLQTLYYLPVCVLSAVISSVAVGLMAELPHDLKYYIRVRGWKDLQLMAVVSLLTIFVSLDAGIMVGVALSVLYVVKHSTHPRITILGRKKGTTDVYLPAEEFLDEVEYLDDFFIIRVPEPLFFANTGQLKDRLRRLEMYRHPHAHPAEDPVCQHFSQVVFDLRGVTAIDPAAMQILCEIVQRYLEQGCSVYFTRVRRNIPELWELIERSGLFDMVGGHSHFLGSITEAVDTVSIRSGSISRVQSSTAVADLVPRSARRASQLRSTGSGGETEPLFSSSMLNVSQYLASTSPSSWPNARSYGSLS